MIIRNLFQEDINRQINGVIKVDQDTADVARQEVKEYVITKELKKHFIQFFDYYDEAFSTPTADIGVWISGFFGSGKSHFLKMLSYILENKEIDGKKTVEYFRDKFADDPATFMLIDKATRKILKEANRNSVAVKYRDIIEMKRADRQELIKGMDVVYIYHDKIDETAHTSEKLVFTACDEAISEIKNMVRIICNEFRGTRVLITADHGFLYTAKPLLESDKIDRSDFGGKEVEYARRYAIMEKGATPEYLMPVKFLDGTQYDGFAPRENIRIKMNGGGLNFVHGGISLQELVVPIIDYRFVRSTNAEYQKNRDKFDTKPVEIGLLSASRKICNMIFSLNFYQKEVVGGIKVPETYVLFFADENGTQVSDVAKIIANKTSENEQDRTFRCTFNLKPINYNNRAKYYLVMKDEAGLQTPQKEEFQIDIAFSVGEFSFFGDEN